MAKCAQKRKSQLKGAVVSPRTACGAAPCPECKKHRGYVMGLLATPARQPCRVLLSCTFRIGSSVFRCFLLCFSIAGWMPAASDGWKQPCGWMMGLIATHSHSLFSRLLQMIFGLLGGVSFSTVGCLLWDGLDHVSAPSLSLSPICRGR